MDADLIALARTLADGGHLPGIYVGAGATTNGNTMVVAPRLYCQSHPQDACTETDIHLACHNAIVAKGWSYRVSAYTSIEDDQGPQRISRMHVKAECTTTLSLLRAYAAALEAK